MGNHYAREYLAGLGYDGDPDNYESASKGIIWSLYYDPGVIEEMYITKAEAIRYCRMTQKKLGISRFAFVGGVLGLLNGVSLWYV